MLAASSIRFCALCGSREYRRRTVGRNRTKPKELNSTIHPPSNRSLQRHQLHELLSVEIGRILTTHLRQQRSGSHPFSGNSSYGTFTSGLLLMDSASTRVITAPALSFHTLTQGFRHLSAYRDLLLSLSQHRIRVRYKQSALGMAWAVVQPLALMLIYTLIFSVFTRVP